MESEHLWADLTPDQRLERRFQIFTDPGIPFASAEAEAAYKARAGRLTDAILLERTPDRVPVCTFCQFYPAYRAGITPHERSIRPGEGRQGVAHLRQGPGAGRHRAIGDRGRRRTALRSPRLQALLLAGAWRLPRTRASNTWSRSGCSPRNTTISSTTPRTSSFTPTCPEPTAPSRGLPRSNRPWGWPRCAGPATGSCRGAGRRSRRRRPACSRRAGWRPPGSGGVSGWTAA